MTSRPTAPLEASRRPEIQTLLLTALAAGRGPRRADWARLTPQDWADLVAVAKEQSCRGLLYHGLNALNVLDHAPEPVRAVLLDSYRANGRRTMRLLGELRRIALAFDQVDVPLIALKGSHLALAVYVDLGLRGMHDLDVLVRHEHLYTAADALIRLGYTPEQPFSRDAEAATTRHHLPPFVKEGCAPVELHSNITSPDQPGSIDAATLWSGCVPFKVGGAQLLGLNAEELLLHVCVHLSYHHQFAFGLRPLCDIAAIVDRYAPKHGLDWDTLLEKTRTRHWERGVYLALYVAHEWIGAAVPGDVLAAIRPPDLDTALIDIVREQMFTGNRFAMTLPIRVARLGDDERWWSRLRYLMERIFVPRRVVAERYALPVRSPRVLPYYAARVLDMARRHGPVLARLLFSPQEDETTLLARRRNALRRWLS